MDEVFAHPLRLGPFAVLAATCLWLFVATRNVSREIGGKDYGFGGTPRPYDVLLVMKDGTTATFASYPK